MRKHHPESDDRAEGDAGAELEELGFVARGDECMEWTAAKRNEYGAVGIKRDGSWRMVDVHRAVKVIIDGASDLLVLHNCGNKSCFRPDHTRYGSYVDNARDAFERGETSGLGETHCKAKLSAGEVSEVRELYFTSGMTQAQVGLIYGVSQSTVSEIARGRHWGS